jgi:hypothetical protein
MSLPVAVTISGMNSLQVLRANLNIAQGFVPMTQKEMTELETRCKDAAGDGRFEPYQISLQFDNPVARMSHAFPLDGQQKEVKEMLEKPFGTWWTS